MKKLYGFGYPTNLAVNKIHNVNRILRIFYNHDNKEGQAV